MTKRTLDKLIAEQVKVQLKKRQLNEEFNQIDDVTSEESFITTESLYTYIPTLEMIKKDLIQFEKSRYNKRFNVKLAIRAIGDVIDKLSWIKKCEMDSPLEYETNYAP